MPAKCPTRIAAVALALLMLSLQGAFAETRIALVIGNGAYEEGPLDNPPRDAELMAETLRALDFAVTFEKNVDQRTMKRLIAGFGDRLRETSDAMAFFYYSGHGMQVKGRNYMIPVDARINDEPDVEIDGVAAWSVLTNMEYAQTRMNIVVLDACRNNPFEKRFKSPQEGTGLAPMPAPAGTLIAYATAPGDVADPGPRGGYSPFTETLASELRTSTASILSLFNSVSSKVYDRTGREQRPYLESSVVPSFSFKRSVAPPQFQVAPLDLEMVVTAGSRINVRAGPGTEFARAGRLESNQPVEVTGQVEGREWYRVRLADGSQGYVFAGLLGEVARPITPGSSRVQQAVGVYPEAWVPGTVFRDRLKNGSDCSFCPEMVVVPAGSFTMGSPEAERKWAVEQSAEQEWVDREKPQHLVKIEQPFAVGKHEVTRDQFAAFVQATGHDMSGGCWENTGSEWKENAANSWRSPGFEQADRDPAVCVSWDDAKAYVVWLSETTGHRYRLPSEAEWEYAARAQTTTMRPWGDDRDNKAGCAYANGADLAAKEKFSHWRTMDCYDGQVYTASVGSYSANAFGLHDMIGNTVEWVEDCWNESYESLWRPDDGGAWTSGDCGRRVLRGGSWSNNPGFLRSAFRGRGNSDDRGYNAGFRVARTLSRSESVTP